MKRHLLSLSFDLPFIVKRPLRRYLDFAILKINQTPTLKNYISTLYLLPTKEHPQLLESSFLAAYEYSGSMAIRFLPQRTPSTTTIAPPTGRQGGYYTGGPVPSGCKRVGVTHIRCTGGGLPHGSVKALAIPYTNNNANDNDNGDHNLAHMRASAISYDNTTTNLPRPAAIPAIDSCTKATGMNRLTCGSPVETISLFVLLLTSIIPLFIIGWLILRSPRKSRDEEKAIEMRPRLDQYQSDSKLRLKEKVRTTSRSSKVVQSWKEDVADDDSEHRSARSTPYVPGWRAAKIGEQDRNLARLLLKELPKGADVSTGSATG